MDEQICKLEGLCSGPRLATMEAWIEYLTTHLQLNDNSTELDTLNESFSSSNLELRAHVENGLRQREKLLEKEKLAMVKVRDVGVQTVFPTYSIRIFPIAYAINYQSFPIHSS